MLRNLGKVLQAQKAKFATAAVPAPHTNPEVLYTGVSLISFIIIITTDYTTYLVTE